MITLSQAHLLLPGSVLVGEGSRSVLRVHSDTRTLLPGDLFVALKGERFDGHDWLTQARSAGAVAALAERGLQAAGLPGLQVADSLLALQALASAWRHRFHLPLVAVTGSNGKTTVTQMIASILRAAHGAGAFATEGNLNNHIGVPLMLLRLRQDDETWHRAGVLELGMNHPGEIAALARMAAPTAALVNNAQREHQEFMDGVAAVARENGSAIVALPASGAAVFPADDAMAPVWREQAGPRRVLRFCLVEPGQAGDAEVWGHALWDETAGAWDLQARTPVGALALRLRMPGRHNARNALAAATAAIAAGEPLTAIVQGLQAFEPVAGRSQLRSLRLQGQVMRLVDDSYNANPDSVLAAIEVLAAMPGPRWLVLGDMGEVGAQGPAFHAEVGRRARECALEHAWFVGAASEHAAAAFGAGAVHLPGVEQALAALAQPPAARSALVKGSRFMRMERVVKALTEAADPQADPQTDPAADAGRARAGSDKGRGRDAA